MECQTSAGGFFCAFFAHVFTELCVVLRGVHVPYLIIFRWTRFQLSYRFKEPLKTTIFRYFIFFYFVSDNSEVIISPQYVWFTSQIWYYDVLFPEINPVSGFFLQIFPNYSGFFPDFLLIFSLQIFYHIFQSRCYEFEMLCWVTCFSFQDYFRFSFTFIRILLKSLYIRDFDPICWNIG